mmetsp:Transcript_41724/g.82555  ORF Transcript_41724/g.82555 Transcript_41724/m.82555 type:complete len:509 (+) Transcript_41724:111-1637(+)|eukprot:CAMPEP_0172661154 /NCGR_PEP_ID=MMETSP1074-20121228/4509_1 /TAXON_ID=2916 /ORGANISM="Ceratium fusus, Strain PA161109" /LENGTH=508 /DNA_ID=CAMNT_0013476883 /DNA_START=92 /DNA_END=1618 /DNA_ORIENTATION=-
MAEQELSKGAKRRANKKAREAAEADDAPPPETKPQTPEPKAKAKGKAKAEAKVEAKPEPKAEPKAKAKAEGKAKAKAEPKAKAEAKAKAQSKSEPQAAEAKTEAPKAAAKPAAKNKASKPKPAAPKVEEEEPKKREPSPDKFLVFDDGTGGDWEECTGLSKKNAKRKERIEFEKVQKKQVAANLGLKEGAVGVNQHVVGLTTTSEKAANTAAKGVTVSQAVAASAVANAAAVAAKGEEPAKETKNTHMAIVKIPESRIGVLIGPKGANIKMLTEKTGAKIDTSSSDTCCITGSEAEVAQAEIAVKELVEKGYTALQYENFSEHFVAVHPSAFPDIIGKEGCVIRKIKEALDVQVSIPRDVPKNPAAGKKYKVTLAGPNKSVEQAKEVINNIIMYYHDPITHPDQVHEELDVAGWQLSFIIGSKGSELRHIQNNYKVRMYIPRETSVNKKVVIVGDQYGVERAKAYVDKLLWNAEDVGRGRGRQDQAEDVWGEEEEEEWMKDYMYRRNK